MQLTGRIRALMLFDVGEEIHLPAVRTILALTETDKGPAGARPGPDYVRFERPPVIEPIENGQLKYYDYGVVSFEADEDFCCDWKSLMLQPKRGHSM